MASSTSPWIHQLNLDRPLRMLHGKHRTDVVVIGGGIAGIATAFFILKYTNKNIFLVEGNRIAHGATGHNAGQIVSYFEHPFSHLTEQYGLVRAARAQEEIYYAWDLIDEMFAEARLVTPLARFTGYAGCSSISQIIDHLENILLQREAGLDIEGALIANVPFVIDRIPRRYHNLFARVDHSYVLNILESNDRRYIGALASRKGCVNSALLCEEMVQYLEKKYKDRFNLYEKSAVQTISLSTGSGMVAGSSYEVTADRVVLCTNGFSNFTIRSGSSSEIDRRFHQSIIGKIGYMAAYLENSNRLPAAISYFSPTQSSQMAFDRNKSLDEQDPYFYLTRRPFDHKTRGFGNLICIGGPESSCDPNASYYDTEYAYPSEAEEQITAFLRTTFRPFSYGTTEYAFTWQGLMGYTPRGVRYVGPDPQNSVLMYNIGCNGVGILSSIYGGKRISNFLLFDRLEPSIFDPVV